MKINEFQIMLLKLLHNEVLTRFDISFIYSISIVFIIYSFLNQFLIKIQFHYFVFNLIIIIINQFINYLV